MKISYSSNKAKKILSLLSGPFLFLLIYLAPLNSLLREGNIILALYAWIMAWWITKPLPWGITSLLPICVLPLFGVMKISQAASAYGQKVFFFLIGVLSLGRAVEKHGLGKRMALLFLSKNKRIKTIYGVLFSYMVIVAIMSAFIDDAAAIAIGVPIGITVTDLVKKNVSSTDDDKKLATFMVLGVLYAAEAGGIMTVAGIPHIGISLSVMEQTTGISLSFLQWSVVGVPIGIVSLLTYYLILRLLYRPKCVKIPHANETFLSEYIAYGKMTPAEKKIFAIFAFTIFLWILPSFVKIKALDVWIAPVIGAILLYSLPEDAAENLLNTEDFQTKLPWNIIFLILGGTAMSAFSEEYGVINWLQGMIPQDISHTAVLFTAAVSTAALSNFISGTATVNIMANIFMPAAISIGIRPEIFAYILPSCGMAVMLPWAGAATGTAFSTGKLSISDMIKSGIIATTAHIFITVALSLLLTNALL